jgi:bifunctional DNA-binding transcriptional regulator/antitoxin component of YhaV-PrlF toxin-antitoxin module
MKRTFELTVRRAGNTLGIALPAEVRRVLGVTAGVRLLLIRTADGYRLTARRSDVERQVKTATKIRKRYRNALRALAH